MPRFTGRLLHPLFDWFRVIEEIKGIRNDDPRAVIASVSEAISLLAECKGTLAVIASVSEAISLLAKRNA